MSSLRPHACQSSAEYSVMNHPLLYVRSFQKLALYKVLVLKGKIGKVKFVYKPIRPGLNSQIQGLRKLLLATGWEFFFLIYLFI